MAIVAAAFHELTDVNGSAAADPVASQAHKLGVTASKDIQSTAGTTRAAIFKQPRDMSFLWLVFMPPLLGFGLLVLLWMAVSITTKGSIPSPSATFMQAVTIFSDPFYSKGPNDQGIGWNILSSLKRVALGFGLAALVGIPVGFMIGRFKFLSSMFNPLISLLRPVSPLAWLPIGLLVRPRRQPGCDLDNFYLLDLAHDHQHRSWCAAGTARLYERGAGAKFK